MHKHNGIFMDDVNSSTISFYHVSKTKKRAKSANFSGINVPNVPKHKTTKLRCNNPIYHFCSHNWNKRLIVIDLQSLRQIALILI